MTCSGLQTPKRKPQRRTLVRLDAVREILRQYAEYLPLTLRQIFYRLVGIGELDKSENEYSNLCEMLNRARRARMIPMSSIRDDGFIGGTGIYVGYSDTADFISGVQGAFNDYARDRQEGQDRRIVLLCEAGGMVPQLERVANPYGVAVKSSGGFDSVTVKHGIAQAWQYEPVPTHPTDRIVRARSLSFQSPGDWSAARTWIASRTSSSNGMRRGPGKPPELLRGDVGLFQGKGAITRSISRPGSAHTGFIAFRSTITTATPVMQ
jgi:hypothetical protein